MRRGAWHQCGHLSQNIVEEQLQKGNGVGAIISPKDYLKHKAIEWAQKYKTAGGEILLDPHFYGPAYTKNELNSYAITQYRASVSNLCKISDADLASLATELFKLHKELDANGIIAPAVAYEYSRPEIFDINARLFRMSKNVGDALGIPTYATVVIGESATKAQHTIDSVLSQATSLNSDGFYFAFSFGASERIPSAYDMVLRCCNAGLTLATSMKPVLHAFAGPMCILSMGMGAQASGIGHFQTVWQFNQAHFEGPAPDQGGGGNAPARFFSDALWGTIVYPDETAKLPDALNNKVFTHSPFSDSVKNSLPWQRFDSYKHLLYMMGKTVETIATSEDPQICAKSSINVLSTAVNLHEQVATETALVLKDETNAYQENWKAAMTNLLTTREPDYDYIKLLK